MEPASFRLSSIEQQYAKRMAMYFANLNLSGSTSAPPASDNVYLDDVNDDKTAISALGARLPICFTAT
jgi:hypothetical protein